MKKSLVLVIAMIGALAALIVAGCGDDNKDDNASTTIEPSTTQTSTSKSQGGGGKGETLKISADPTGALKFDTNKLSGKAGELTIVMDNPSTVPHAVSVEGNGIEEEGTGGDAGVGKGKKSTVKADLKPGKYTFYCPVPGHEEAGMKGTLTVE